MGGVILAIGLTCVGMGLPMIAAENGFWDPLGAGLLAGGAALALAGIYLIWWRNRTPRGSSETTVNAEAAALVGPAIANPQAGRDIHVGDQYHMAKPPDPGVPLNRAIANSLTELDAIQRRLIEAGRTGRLVWLPANHHQAAADLMADHGWLILDESLTTPTTPATTFSTV